MAGEVAKTVTRAAKTIAVYLVLEVLAVGLVAILFSTPLRKLFLPFVLFLVPGVVVVPLIFNARRYLDRPKACALWFAIALSVFCLLITIATTYSAIALGLWTDDAAKDMPLVAAFGCAVSAVIGYRLTHKRLTAKRS
jgi:uncharacterized membrane protein